MGRERGGGREERRVARHWSRMPMLLLESPSLELLKNHVGMAPADMVEWPWWC